MDSFEKALLIKDAILEKKGRDVQFLKIDEITEIADYFVIAMATNRTQAQAIAGEVEFKLKEQGAEVLRREGYEAGTWVLLDFGDVIVHIFQPEDFRYFNLPRLWRDAEVMTFDQDGQLIAAEKPVFDDSDSEPTGDFNNAAL